MEEQLLTVRVMRLSKPTLSTPIIVTSDPKDLPGNLLNNALKHDPTAVPGTETLAAGQFLSITQNFGNIYLGETFSGYICVVNTSSQTVTGVSMKVDLQTTSERIPLVGYRAGVKPKDLLPGDTLEEVIHHDVRELGLTMLICDVSYSSTFSFRKCYKFPVLKPLNITTKFYTAEADRIFLEAQIQNITTGPICLEKVSLESSDLFKVLNLNLLENGDSVFGHINMMPVQTTRQFLYCLLPQPALLADQKLLNGATNIGKLDIVWRSNLGEKGRLQVCQLDRQVPAYRDMHLSITELPNIVQLEKPFNFKCRITNTSERLMNLVLNLLPVTGLAWRGISGKHLGPLEPNKNLEIPLSLVPLSTGLLFISGIQIVDRNSKEPFVHDEIAKIFVIQDEIAADS
ncbi:unnamed protein product [Bemisia tabaci]|uniref:Trafficking protein particle complex subunit 13 n=1 Tax=Bemisia tabaci TaxID=7038 RepID=A0A9P0A4A2_BEMTA|nr:unnamed protein product [Bemisia tabaci]